MSVDYYYKFCTEHMHREVEIRDHHGKVYVGTIERVDREKVYIRQAARPSAGHSGPGVFFPSFCCRTINWSTFRSHRFR
ncbi:MAG: hypothetical protein LRY73_03535 [Bacillus sp. (in: Bacteria)]|nr:hypothetical protein [Bacillus sp. (in: firmicutes)]